MRSPAAPWLKEPISAIRPSRTPMSREPIPSWLTNVPLIRMQSKLGGMADLSCSDAKAAYLTVSALASATGGLSMHKKAAMLEDRGVLSVSGEDATTFLQGLLTNDVEGLASGEARYAALLTPQGKI